MTPHQARQLSDIWEIKQALDMAYVMHREGHDPEVNHRGTLSYINPFREEEHPSFDIFEHQIKGRPAPEQRFDDRAEDHPQGDVLDLIARFHPGNSAPQVKDLAIDYLAAQIEEDWSGATTAPKERVSLDINDIELLQDLARPLSTSKETWWKTIQSRPGLMNVALPDDRVFIDPRGDAIVFVLKDGEGNIEGGRKRFMLDGKQAKSNIPGTPPRLMRLNDATDRPVLLTEGETDLWAAWAVHHEAYEVLGVPGIGNIPENVARNELDGREVTIMFDSDTAGHKGAAAWRAFLLERGCTVRVAVLPNGKDICKLTAEQIERLPDRARVLPPNTDKLYRQGAQFVWVKGGKNEDVEAVSNWSFEPCSVLVGDDNVRSYEGVLLPLGRSVVLPASALANANNLLKWGEQYQARWVGNNGQVQHLAMLLDHQAAFLPEGRITDQVGLHEGTFVWQDGFVGEDPVHYVEPTASINLNASHIDIEEAPINPVAAFGKMMATQHPAVVGPILAWLAVAPLRSRFKQFPILSISGGSGSGKTSLTEELVRAFTGSDITLNLTSTTPHAVMAFIASSNGFPVRFDEYRPGANQQAKEALDQTLRDAYTGQVSAKGGQNRSNLNQVNMIRTDAPIIVTGEDNFTETSHTDRMVLVRLLSSEKGDLGALQRFDTTGFAHAYLSSLQHSDVAADEAPVHATYRPTPVPGLRDRQGANAAVLQVGWNLLEGFLTAYDPTFVMPELDLSRSIEAGEAAGTSDPVMEAVRYCLENQAELVGPAAAWIDGDDLFISAPNLLAQAEKIKGVTLPTSNAQGITSLLIDVHGAESKRVRTSPGPYSKARQMRVCAIPLDRLEWLDTPDEELSDGPDLTI